MALIQCPECNKEVSTAASVCVHCGHPMREPQTQKPQQVVRSGGRFELIGFVLILAAILSPWVELGRFGIPLFVIGFVVFLAGRFK